MEKPTKTDSANCFCDVYVADDMNAYLSEQEEIFKVQNQAIDYLEKSEKEQIKKNVEKDEKIKLLEMANKNGNYVLADKCDEFNKYAEKTEKRIERLRERLTEITQICVGFDGYNSVKGLKGLIDDIKDYAGKAFKETEG